MKKDEKNSNENGERNLHEKLMRLTFRLRLLVILLLLLLLLLTGWLLLRRLLLLRLLRWLLLTKRQTRRTLRQLTTLCIWCRQCTKWTRCIISTTKWSKLSASMWHYRHSKLWLKIWWLIRNVHLHDGRIMRNTWNIVNNANIFDVWSTE